LRRLGRVAVVDGQGAQRALQLRAARGRERPLGAELERGAARGGAAAAQRHGGLLEQTPEVALRVTEVGIEALQRQPQHRSALGQRALGDVRQDV